MKQQSVLKIIRIVTFFWLFIFVLQFETMAQTHPEIYITNSQKENFQKRLLNSKNAREMVDEMKVYIEPFVERHKTDPDWIVSRLQMYWKTKYKRVFVNGMDFSHGEGSAPVPTVRFSGSRDWATDYLQPELEDIKPYMDDERGLYLQNGAKEGKPWEWVKPSETGHIIERINREILDLAEDAAFLFWLTGEEKYAVFASDIFMPYIEGMYYRDPPQTFEDHKNALLMGLQTFEVIHEGVVEPVTVCYDFLYFYLKETGKNLKIIQDVFRKWADQEIKYGVPDNNWNLMQARFITYLAIALENDGSYEDGKGQQYYIDQVLNQNSTKQKALKDVVKNFDSNTGIWPEVAHYSIMVSDDILEIYSLMDKTLNNNLLEKYPILEKAILANFNYLFPNGFTTAYGDAKHARLRFNSLELLVAQYRKYGKPEKETLITKQLKRFIEDGAYNREKINSLFQLFFYVEELLEVPAAVSSAEMVVPTFYSPNVSWVVQRNGNSVENGMMISKNASLGNHSHTNGINMELFAKGMAIAPDCAAGVSYWTEDHRDYYSRFAAHNTVVVDGISDYRNMRGTQAFTLNSIYPSTESENPLMGDFTFSDVSFSEPSTDAFQQRLTGTVRTSESTGYFVDIFRSSRNDGNDKKHEYLFHSQGENIELTDFERIRINTSATEELSSEKGDLPGYNYFKNKQEVKSNDNFIAHFKMSSVLNEKLNLNLWMKGFQGREIFTVLAPYSRAIHQETVPEELYHKKLPTLVVRQKGEARTKPFVAIIDAFNESEKASVESVEYFYSENKNPGFVGIAVHSKLNRTDYIFNDENSVTLNDFSDGKFQGNYGIVSFQNEKMRSMFLGNGKLLERGSWKIESVEMEGSFLILPNSEGFLIDASQSFKLTFPVSNKTKKEVVLKIEDQEQEILYKGKVFKIEKQKVAVFELPPLKRVQLKYL